MPEDNRERYPKWTMGEPASSFTKFFHAQTTYSHYITEFEQDVTSNPFSNPVRDRITKIQRVGRRFEEGCYRWSKSVVRIVYLPDKETHTVLPLYANTAGNVKYKKR